MSRQPGFCPQDSRVGKHLIVFWSSNTSCFSYRLAGFAGWVAGHSSSRIEAKSKSVTLLVKASESCSAERPAQVSTRNWLMTMTRRSLTESARPHSFNRLAFAVARSTASCKAIWVSDLFRMSAVCFRQTKTTSSWIGSFAWDLGAATDISDFTGWQLRSEKPARTMASANEVQPVIRE